MKTSRAPRELDYFMNPRRPLSGLDRLIVAAFWAVVVVFLVFFWSAVLSGCAGTQTRQIPAGCEGSMIYAKTNPEALNAVGLISVSELTRFYPSARPFLVGACEDLRDMLEDSRITYVELAQAAVQRVAWVNSNFGARLLVYTELLSMFDKPVPLDPCDADLIRAHLGKQLAYLRAENGSAGK